METASSDDVEFLARISLFAHVKREYLASIAARLEERQFARDDVIFEAGTEGDAMYIIRSGAVGVFLVDPSIGLRFELARLRTGQVFGEMAVITRQRRSATCRALEPTRCLVLSHETFLAIVERIPQVALSCAAVLAERLDHLNRERGWAKVNLSELRVDPEVFRLIPRRILERHRMMPVNMVQGKLMLACVDPDDLAAIDEVRRILRGVEVLPVGVSDSDFTTFFEQHSALLPKEMPVSSGLRLAPVRWIAEEIREEKLEAGDETKLLVDMIISQGVDLEASDIHIAPELDGVQVRYRVAGSLVGRRGAPIPRGFHRAIASRIKVLADLDISERRRPQDGRLSCRVGDRAYDLRVSTMPTHEGEKVVMRLLANADAVQPLERLVLAEKVCRVVRQMVNRPYGVVFVCGPTGSGKTTTLYSAVGLRRNSDTNITTVEDPVEYNLPGVTQVSVHPEIGLNFASVLRSMLRQDPDVLMVGETRDHETAKLVVEAGLTGHLVLTSLHTNDAVGAIQRLREMAVENYAIAAGLVGVISQRLVRRLCPNCAQEERPSPPIVDQLVLAGIVKPGYSGTVRRAVGCETCGGTGYRGRVGVYELLVADDELRRTISDGADHFKLRETALQGAFVPMARYANYLLTNGLTSPEELLAIVGG